MLVRDATEKPSTRGRARQLHWVQALDVLGLQSFFAGDDVERDLFTLVQSLETGPDNGRVVDENILAGILGDETKPLFIVEPLYFAASHNSLLSRSKRARKTKWTPLSHSECPNNIKQGCIRRNWGAE